MIYQVDLTCLESTISGYIARILFQISAKKSLFLAEVFGVGHNDNFRDLCIRIIAAL